MRDAHKDTPVLNRLNEVSFMLNDLTFYMATHPADERAADWFHEYDTERKKLLEALKEETEKDRETNPGVPEDTWR